MRPPASIRRLAVGMLWHIDSVFYTIFRLLLRGLSRECIHARRRPEFRPR